MTEALIIRDDHKLSIAFTAAALELKESALATAALIGRVSTPEENANAVQAQKELKRILGLCEEARKLCKQPVLDFGREIDGKAKAFAEEIDREFMRVTKLVADFQALELAKQRAAEAARRLEEEKLQREKEAEERRILEESRAAERKLAEQEAAAAKALLAAKTEKEHREAAALQNEIDRQRALAAAQTHEQLEAVQERTNQAAAALPRVEAAKADGQSVKEEWVIDQIREFELMKARPDLVRKVEFDLLAIKQCLKAGLKLPGVTAHQEVRATVTRGRQAATLEIA